MFDAESGIFYRVIKGECQITDIYRIARKCQHLFALSLIAEHEYVDRIFIMSAGRRDQGQRTGFILFISRIQIVEPDPVFPVCGQKVLRVNIEGIGMAFLVRNRDLSGRAVGLLVNLVVAHGDRMIDTYRSHTR